MNKKLFFSDGSALEISIAILEEGKMGKVAYKNLVEFIGEDLPDDPQLALHQTGEDEELLYDLDDDELDEEELDLELLEDLDEEWLGEEDFDEDELDDDDLDDESDDWDDDLDEFDRL